MASGGTNGGADEIRKLSRGCYRFSVACLNQFSCDAARGGVFAELEDELGKVALGEAVDEFGGGDGERGIQPHVEWAVAHETEAPLGGVHLIG